MLGLFYRTFYTDSSSTSLLKLYATVIRPSLEYACQVWDPHLVKDIEKLEGVPKFALRICLKKWEMGVGLLLISNLPTVANCRKYFKPCTMFKNRSLHFHQNLFTLRTTPYIHPSSHLYQIPFCRTKTTQDRLRLEFAPLLCEMIWNIYSILARMAQHKVYIFTYTTFTSSSAIAYVSLKKKEPSPHLFNILVSSHSVLTKLDQPRMRHTLLFILISPNFDTSLLWTNLSMFVFCSVIYSYVS